MLSLKPMSYIGIYSWDKLWTERKVHLRPLYEKNTKLHYLKSKLTSGQRFIMCTVTIQLLKLCGHLNAATAAEPRAAWRYVTSQPWSNEEYRFFFTLKIWSWSANSTGFYVNICWFVKVLCSLPINMIVILDLYRVVPLLLLFVEVIIENWGWPFVII
jgi:hypothetical protein